MYFLYIFLRPEDNDDIIALQAVEMPELREELGEFYIAEEVLHFNNQPSVKPKDSPKSD